MGENAVDHSELDQAMTARENPRIGVVICRCGDKIASRLDIEDLCRRAAALPGVHYVGSEPYPCSQDGLARLQQAIGNHDLNRILVAGCPARLIRSTFHQGVEATGLGFDDVTVVDIREGCAFAHQDDPEAAQRKAEDQIRMATAHLAAGASSHVYTGRLVRAALVIGSDLGGLIAATTLAHQGIPVTLVDQQDALDKSEDHWEVDASQLFKAQLTTALHHPQITALPGTWIAAIFGQPGDYLIQLARQEKPFQLNVGAIVISTGLLETAPAVRRPNTPLSPEKQSPRPEPDPSGPGSSPEAPDDLLPIESPRRLNLDSLASWLHLPQDMDGFLVKNRPRLHPGHFSDDGVFIVGRAHQPATTEAVLSQALLASAQAIHFLAQTALRTEAPRAAIDPAGCTGCGTCVPVCPNRAISLTERPGVLSVAQVAALRCTGCGGCVVACPTRAISLPGSEDSAILAQINAALEAPAREIRDNGNAYLAPRLLAFACEWSAHAAAELAGARQVSYSPDLRIIPLTCAARFDPQHVLWAFLNGADGVLLGACCPGECHHRTGNQLAEDRLLRLKTLLAANGVDPRRLQLAHLAGDDVQTLVKTITDFSNYFLDPEAQIKRLDEHGRVSCQKD